MVTTVIANKAKMHRLTLMALIRDATKHRREPRLLQHCPDHELLQVDAAVEVDA